MGEAIEFSVYDGRICLAKLPPGTDIASLTRTDGFFSVSCTDEEISIVAHENFAHAGAEILRGWRAIKIKGPLEFELKGVLASLLNPLNEANVSVFAMSTYSTDYIFVMDYHLDLAIHTLVAAGHRHLK